MKFVVHNHYNNNSYIIAGNDDGSGKIGFAPAWGAYIITEIDVTVTNRGIVFFLLSKFMDLSEKIEFTSVLQRKLQERFGHGLNAATCADSDCIQMHDINPFYDGMKAINQEIVTVHGGIAREWNAKADHFLERDSVMAARLIEILKPSLEDCLAPAIGWDAYQSELLKIYAETQWQVEDRRGTLIGKRPFYETHRLPYRRGYEIAHRFNSPRPS